jgi:hypothetical protein
MASVKKRHCIYYQEYRKTMLTTRYGRFDLHELLNMSHIYLKKCELHIEIHFCCFSSDK